MSRMGFNQAITYGQDSHRHGFGICSIDFPFWRICSEVLSFDFLARRDELVEEKNPRAYASRLTSTDFFRVFRVFRGSDSSRDWPNLPVA